MLTANSARGEVVVTLASAPRRLCLTLGALARIEAALGLTDWSQLPDRIATLSAGDLSAVLLQNSPLGATGSGHLNYISPCWMNGRTKSRSSPTTPSPRM